MTDMDWAAAMDSEIFREYARSESLRMRVEASQAKQAEDTFETLQQFEAFEAEIKSSPEKLAVFRALRDKIASDPDYADQINPAFLDAMMMLNLD